MHECLISMDAASDPGFNFDKAQENWIFAWTLFLAKVFFVKCLQNESVMNIRILNVLNDTCAPPPPGRNFDMFHVFRLVLHLFPKFESTLPPLPPSEARIESYVAFSQYKCPETRKNSKFSSVVTLALYTASSSGTWKSSELPPYNIGSGLLYSFFFFFFERSRSIFSVQM